MASFAQLPDELRRLLESVTGSFSSTATKFLDAIPNPDQHFARACEILNTVCNGSSDWRPSERTVGFRLNAAFTLYWLYREYDIRINPFVSHFVDTCEAERSPPPSSVHGAEKESQSDRLRRARCKIMMAILGSEGSKLSDLSPKEFFNNFDQMKIGETADLKLFPNDVEEIPIMAWSNRTEQQQQQQPTKYTNGYHPNGSSGGGGLVGRQKAVGTASPAPGQNRQPVFAQNFPVLINQKDHQTNASINAAVEEAISNAHIRHLNSKEKNLVLSNMEYAGRRYQPVAAEDLEIFKRMLDLNFDILQSLAVEVLKRQVDDTARLALLNTALPKLNLELRSLDLINHIVVRPTRDETRPQSRTSITATTTSSRKSTPASSSSPAGTNDGNKPALLTTEERTHLLHVFISNCILQLEAPYGDLDDIPATTRRAKGPDVARRVKLLCMFITNLLTRDIVTAQELYFEMQNLYMGFTSVKEARELWTNATGGRGVGMVDM